MSTFEREYWDAKPIMDAMVYPEVRGEEPLAAKESERRFVERRKALAARLEEQDLESILSTTEGEQHG